MNVQKYIPVFLIPLLITTFLFSSCVLDQPQINQSQTGLDRGAIEEQSAEDPTTGTAGVSNAPNELVLASSFTDYNFQNGDGEITGSIQDLILDLTTGDVLYVTVEYGGFLDIGDTELPMPLRAFAWGPDGVLVLNLNEEQLNNLPDSGTDWLDPTAVGWQDEIVSFWRDIDINPGVDFTAAGNAVIRAEEVLNYTTEDLGLGIGEVADLLINLGESRIAYALVSFEPGVIDNDLLAIPLDAFEISMLDPQLTFAEGVDAAVIEDAPFFTADVYTTADAETFIEINDYWQALGFDTNVGDTPSQ